MIKLLIYIFWAFIYKTSIYKLIKKFNLNYPSKIRHDIHNILKKENFQSKIKINKSSYKFIKISENKLVNKKIELASDVVDLKKIMKLKYLSDDSENIESIFRFSWIMKDFERNNFNYFKYNLNHLKIIQIKSNFKSFYEDSYTTSERIENSILFFCLTNSLPTAEVKNNLNNDIVYLLNNLEYQIHGFNNHLFKNFKSLYIAGLFLDNEKLTHIFRQYIIDNFTYFVDDDCLLAEGSSHYILLFYKWCIDILFYSKIYSDKIMYEFILSKIKIMKKNLNIFFYNIDFFDKDCFINFGDISPDYSLNYILSFTKFLIDKTNLFNKNIFLDKQDKKIINLKNWIWKNTNNSLLVIRKINLNKLDYHEHEDFFHFHFSYKNQLIFSDSGNKNFKEDDSRKYYKSLRAHNSIIVDNYSYRTKWSTFFSNKENYKIELINNKIIYIFQKNNIKIKRSINTNEEGIVIEDSLNLNRKYNNIEIIFQLNPKANIKILDDNSYVLSIKNVNLSFIIKTNENYHSIIKKNYYSDKYGDEINKKYISINFNNIKNLKTKFVLKEIN